MSHQRQFIQQYIANDYGILPQILWQKHPSFAVFRHQNKQSKWFALVADVSKNKLGLIGDEVVPILNVKCRPETILLLRQDKQILPAYHMNKEHWFTILLDNGFTNDELRYYLDWSFDLTK